MSSHLPVLGMYLRHLLKPASFLSPWCLLIQIVLTHLAHVTASPGCLHAVIHRAASVTPVGSMSVSSYKHFGDCIIFRAHTKVLLSVACPPPIASFPIDRTQAGELLNVDNVYSPDGVCSLLTPSHSSHCSLHSKSFCSQLSLVVVLVSA